MFANILKYLGLRPEGVHSAGKDRLAQQWTGLAARVTMPSSKQHRNDIDRHLSMPDLNEVGMQIGSLLLLLSSEHLPDLSERSGLNSLLSTAASLDTRRSES